MLLGEITPACEGEFNLQKLLFLCIFTDFRLRRKKIIQKF